MSAILAGIFMLSLVYIFGVTIALFTNNFSTIVELFNDVRQAIADIKIHKATRRIRGS